MILSGRTMLITGGSAGIGLAFALKFLELGNKVIVTGRRQAVLDKVKGDTRSSTPSRATSPIPRKSPPSRRA